MAPTRGEMVRVVVQPPNENQIRHAVNSAIAAWGRIGIPGSAVDR
jgi:hypothetical protein